VQCHKCLQFLSKSLLEGVNAFQTKLLEGPIVCVLLDFYFKKFENLPGGKGSYDIPPSPLRASMSEKLTNERMLCPVVVSRQAPDEAGVVRAVGVRLDPLDLPLAQLGVVLRARRLLGSLGVTGHK
jgi:hypothetical protein